MITLLLMLTKNVLKFQVYALSFLKSTESNQIK
jgi:hypothetical protein